MVKTNDFKKINCAEHEYMNWSPPPPPYLAGYAKFASLLAAISRELSNGFRLQP